MTDKESIQYVISKVNNADEKGVELTEFDINKVETLISIINRQQAEIERLNNNISAMATTLSNSAKATRNEAIKEFAERLCEGRLSNDPIVIAVKCELKEMVGDDK